MTGIYKQDVTRIINHYIFMTMTESTECFKIVLSSVTLLNLLPLIKLLYLRDKEI